MRAVPVSDVRTGDAVVCGASGVRVALPPAPPRCVDISPATATNPADRGSEPAGGCGHDTLGLAGLALFVPGWVGQSRRRR